MLKMRGVFVVTGLAALLAGCSLDGLELDKTRGLEPTGSAFGKAQFSEYVGRSQVEFTEGDYENSDLFALKAQAAAGGEDVAPEELADHTLPAETLDELDAARARLIAALDGNARTTVPELAAHVQLMFDCWVEEQEENRQPDDIAACRGAFLEGIAQLEAALPPKPVPAPEPMPEPEPVPEPMPAPEPVPEPMPAPVPVPEPMPAPMPAPVPIPAPEPVPEPMPAPKPAPAPVRQSFLIFFDFDSIEIDQHGRTVVEWVANQVAVRGTPRVRVSGFTDRAGSNPYNLSLSVRRAEAVAAALVRAGVRSDVIVTTGVGEASPRVATPDDQREPANRVARITLEK